MTNGKTHARHLRLQIDGLPWSVTMTQDGLAFREYRKRRVYQLTMRDARDTAVGQFIFRTGIQLTRRRS